jgi:hypothetical protein
VSSSSPARPGSPACSGSPPIPASGRRTTSQRAASPLKTKQKISGRLTSDNVTQDRLDIRSYLGTARKHGLGAYEVLHQLMTGNPWPPPAQPVYP